MENKETKQNKEIKIVVEAWRFFGFESQEAFNDFMKGKETK